MKECPSCGSTYITEKDTETTFQYGIEPDAVQITVIVPVTACHSCEFSFTDYRSEEIRDAATEKYRKKGLII